MESDIAGVLDTDVAFWGAYAKVNYDMGPAYFGGLFAYITGDDPNTADKIEGDMMHALHAGENFAPCLLLYNYSYNTWVGGAEALGGYMDNILLGQIYAGFKPIPKLDVKASITYAKADQKPAGFMDDEYGTEFDLTSSFKIFDNLSYMVGAAYLKAGDYFKGTDPNYKVGNNYILIHNLTLTF